MKRILMIGGLLILAMCFIGAKPLPTPMQLDFEKMRNCGAEGNLTDGCIGMDEKWVFQARGDLSPGESFTYSIPESMCHAYSKINAVAFVYRGNAKLLVTIDVWDTMYSWNDEGMGSACIVPPPGDGHGHKHWQITVTNTHSHRTVKNVFFYGSARGTPYASNSCPF